jgi:hypothetical protein
MSAAFVAVCEGEEVVRTVAPEPDDEEQALLMTTARALAKAEQTGKPLTLVGQWSDASVYLARVNQSGIAWELGRRGTPCTSSRAKLKLTKGRTRVAFRAMDGDQRSVWRMNLVKLAVFALMFVVLGLAASDERLAPWLTAAVVGVIALVIVLGLRQSRR